MDFEVIIDSTLLDLGIAGDIDLILNKWLLSVINDFEDGHWRQQKFDNFVWDNIAQTALSQKEREALQGQPQSLLVAAAKNLRLTDVKQDIGNGSETDEKQDIGNGSELAEIILYGIMRHKYNALPVVPKIFYKQNTQDNTKGADSVHIVVEPNGGFSLWFGEAKFYNSIVDTRLSSIMKSVRNSLNTEKLKKENSIITNLAELDRLDIDRDTQLNIKEALANRNSIDSIKKRINIPILLLHECSLTAEASERTEEYVAAVREYHKERATTYFRKQAVALRGIFKYTDVRFHLILFPVPEKQPIIDRFVNSAAFYRS